MTTRCHQRVSQNSPIAKDWAQLFHNDMRLFDPRRHQKDDFRLILVFGCRRKVFLDVLGGVRLAGPDDSSNTQTTVKKSRDKKEP